MIWTGFFNGLLNMFDTFDILLPNLLPIPGGEIQQRETAFGLDDRKFLYIDNIQLAIVLPAKTAFSAVEAWTGAPNRDQWSALLVANRANEAATDSTSWSAFLESIRIVLKAHPIWRVTCESDCDQHALQCLALDPDSLVELLDQYRNTNHFPISFYTEFSRACSH